MAKAADRDPSERSAPVPAPQLLLRASTVPLPPVVVLAGAERWFREAAVEALIARVFPAGDPGGGVLRLSARDPEDRLRVPQAVEELRAASLFGAGRVVVVEHPEAVAGAAAAEDGEEEGEDGVPAVAGAAAGPAEGAAAPAKRSRSPLLDLALPALEAAIDGALLLLSTSRPVKGKGAVPVATLAKHGALVVDCRALYDAPAPWERGAAPHEHELARHLVARMKARFRRRLDAAEAHALTRRVGSDLDALEKALQTLALYVGERAAVTAADVDACFQGEREDPVWPLVDAVLAGRLPEAVERLHAALTEGLADVRGPAVTRPEALFPLISGALLAGYRRVLAGAEMLARGEGEEAVARAAGLPAFLAAPHVARCRRDPADWLGRHGAFLEAERGVKGGGVPPEVALERLVVALGAPAGGSAGRVGPRP